VPEVKASPEVFLNFREAAFVLGIKSNIVRGLVAQGLLGVAAGYRNGFAKLISHGVRTRHYECHGSVAAQGSTATRRRVAASISAKTKPVDRESAGSRSASFLSITQNGPGRSSVRFRRAVCRME